MPGECLRVKNDKIMWSNDLLSVDFLFLMRKGTCTVISKRTMVPNFRAFNFRSQGRHGDAGLRLVAVGPRRAPASDWRAALPPPDFGELVRISIAVALPSAN